MIASTDLPTPTKANGIRKKLYADRSIANHAFDETEIVSKAGCSEFLNKLRDIEALVDEMNRVVTDLAQKIKVSAYRWMSGITEVVTESIDRPKESDGQVRPRPALFSVELLRVCAVCSLPVFIRQNHG